MKGGTYDASVLTLEKENTMDPNACFQRIVNALADFDAEEAESAYADLCDWIKRGGFVPRAFLRAEIRNAFAEGFEELSLVLYTEAAEKRLGAERN